MVAVMPGFGGKPVPREWLRGKANVGQAEKAKSKRRAERKRARTSKRGNRS